MPLWGVYFHSWVSISFVEKQQVNHGVGLWSKDISRDAQTGVGKVAAAIWVPRLWGHKMTLILACKYRACIHLWLSTHESPRSGVELVR